MARGCASKERPMSGRDVFEFINKQDEATLQSLINRLEFRGNDPTFVGYRDAYVDRMGLSASAAVLDIGCGTGVFARALARRPGFSGSIYCGRSERRAGGRGASARVGRGPAAAHRFSASGTRIAWSLRTRASM